MIKACDSASGVAFTVSLCPTALSASFAHGDEWKWVQTVNSNYFSKESGSFPPFQPCFPWIFCMNGIERKKKFTIFWGFSGAKAAQSLCGCRPSVWEWGAKWVHCTYLGNNQQQVNWLWWWCWCVGGREGGRGGVLLSRRSPFKPNTICFFLPPRLSNCHILVWWDVNIEWRFGLTAGEPVGHEVQHN